MCAEEGAADPPDEDLAQGLSSSGPPLLKEVWKGKKDLRPNGSFRFSGEVCKTSGVE
jgi:hypothetical protein